MSARLQRRLEVCDRLKMLALETKDVRLEQAVSDLENLVWQWYWQEQPRHPASPKAPGTSRDAVPSSSTTAPQNNPSASPKTSADKEPTLSGTSVTPGRAYRTDWAIRGIPAHERLDRTDMHTVRGCSLDHSLPVVELAPRFPSSPNQEIRR
ncbi:MAG: hypothetical protein NZM42_02635 [Gemmatales bacterium]|nr:hypothetical protein [Gemmatales bacterium]MDW8222745.1 hypothetical protein [Gemmatales bacterium]